MDQLNNLDTDAIKEIVNIGLAKAADALAMIINEKVLIKCVELKSPGDVFSGIDNDQIYLSTEINGDIKGVCYFIISKHDAAFLVGKALPNSASDEPFVIDEMNEGFLLELDNIISAAVTTQLANLLQMNIFGDVPKLNKWDTLNSRDPLYDKFKPLFLKTEFQIQSVTFSPGFYWFLEPKIMTKIREIVDAEISIK